MISSWLPLSPVLLLCFSSTEWLCITWITNPKKGIWLIFHWYLSATWPLVCWHSLKCLWKSPRKKVFQRVLCSENCVTKNPGGWWCGKRAIPCHALPAVKTKNLQKVDHSLKNYIKANENSKDYSTRKGIFC